MPLTLPQCIYIANMVVAAPFWYTACFMYCPPSVIKQIRNIMTRVVWKVKTKGRVAFPLLTKSREYGGLQLIDPETYIRATRLIVFRYLLQPRFAHCPPFATPPPRLARMTIDRIVPSQ